MGNLTEIKCPKCETGNLIKRNGKNGSFLGCSNFPSCRNTRSLSATPLRPIKKTSLKKIVPNKYQADIFDKVEAWGRGNKERVITTACAGSGKTTTVEHAIHKLAEGTSKVYYMVFAQQNKREAEEKLPGWVNVVTAHSFGFRLLREYYTGDLDVRPQKVGDILNIILGPGNFDAELFFPARKLVSYLKNTLSEPTAENCKNLLDHYGAVYTISREMEIISLALKALDKSDKLAQKIIDYDDMVYMPAKLGIKTDTIKFGFLDEVQDWNTPMIKMFLSSLAERSRVLAVGDENQSIFGFRGADSNAMTRVQESLGAIPLPLSISYRVPLSGVNLVNSEFPHIDFQAPPTAIEGEIIDFDYGEFIEKADTGDLVICRTNAPIMKAAFALIRAGTPVNILGRQFKEELINITTQVGPLSMSATEWERLLTKKFDAQISQLLSNGKYSAVASLEDKLESLLVFREGCDTAQEILNKIERLYGKAENGVRLSTVHRAKGLEADRVMILKPNLMPLPYAEQGWQMIEETNIKYVAFTRHKKSLVFVRD